MNNFKLLNIFMAFVISLFLAGCNENSELRFEMEQQAATQNPDAWDAYLKLGESVSSQHLTSDSFFENKAQDELLSKYKSLGVKLYAKALKQDSKAAIVDLFSREPSLSDSLDQFRDKYASKFIQDAEFSNGNKSDSTLLYAAAQVLQEGRWVNKDSYHASALYARAWLAGAIQSPAELYKLFVSVKDPASAYLWALRCIGKCTINSSVVASETESQLTLEQIIRIQNLAKDQSVITLNGIAAKDGTK